MLVNLGSGSKRSNNKDWINYDAVAGPNVDVVSDIRYVNLSQKADMIRASHVLEHIAPSEMIPTLTNWFWSLKDDGYIIIGVPDFKAALKHFANAENQNLCFWKPDFDPFLLTQIYGIQFSFKESVDNTYSRHRMIFSEESLTSLLKQVGFENVMRFFPETIDDNSGFDDFMLRKYSLNMIATKPKVNWKYLG